MRPGKLTNEDLKTSVLSALRPHRADVLLRPGIGEDCGAVRFGEEACVLSTDPITVKTALAGQLAVQVSLNDVAAAGAEPVGILLTVLVPPSATLDEVHAIVAQASEAAEKEGVEILGGHTEVTDAVNRIVLSTTVVGRAPVSRLITGHGAKAGDALVLTKSAGLEGAAILAGEHAAVLARTVPKSVLAEAAGFASCLSVQSEGRVAAQNGAHAMHDVTEGGVLGAAWEMAEAAGIGLVIEQETIPVHAATKAICTALQVNPYRLISSGSMLIAHPDGAALVRVLEKAGIEAAVIGAFQKDLEKTLVCQGVARPLEAPQGDEIYLVGEESR